MKKTYNVELKGKDWTEILDRTFEKKKKEIKVDGFRKGQVPKEVYIKKYGVESLYMDSIDEALSKMYKNLLEEDKTIIPACSPAVDLKKVDESHVEATFVVVFAPEVKLGNYKDLKVKREDIIVTDEEINHEIEHLKENYAEHKLLEDGEKIEKGHIVNLNFEGFIDGTAFEGGKADNYSITIGSNTFIPGFEDGLIGLSNNEEKDLNLKFPENYHVDDLKGKDVVFKVKINNIKERILPNLDENFYKDLGLEGVDNEEKLKEEIRLNIGAGKERELEDKYIFECLDKVVKNAKFEVESEIIDEEVERIIKEFDEKLTMQGMNIDKYLEMTKSKIEDLKTQVRPEAEKRVNYRLVIDAVAKKENIEVSNEELESEVDSLAKKYNMKKEDFLKQVGGTGLIEYDMKMRKSVEIITGRSK